MGKYLLFLTYMYVGKLYNFHYFRHELYFFKNDFLSDYSKNDLGR